MTKRNAGIVADAGGSAAWSPSVLSPIVWFDAQDLNSITKDGSDKVATWANKGSGGNAVAADANSKPTYLSSGLISGKPAIRFNGSANKLSGSATLSGGNGTFFIFFTQASGGNSSCGIFEMANTGLSTQSSNDYANCAWLRRFSTLLRLSYNQVTTLSYTFAADTPLMWSSWKDAAANLISRYINDAVSGTSSVGVSGSNLFNCNTFGLGINLLNNAALGTYYFAGDIFEVYLFGSRLSDADRNKLHGYVAHRWGKADLLAANHPYKNAPPTA